MYWFGGIFGMVLLVAVGFVVLHFAEKEKSFNLKIAGYLLAASGAILAISTAIMVFFGGCRYDGMGHHGGMHGSHGMMRGCDHIMEEKGMDGTNMPKMHNEMMKDSPGVK